MRARHICSLYVLMKKNDQSTRELAHADTKTDGKEAENHVMLIGVGCRIAKRAERAHFSERVLASTGKAAVHTLRLVHNQDWSRRTDEVDGPLAAGLLHGTDRSTCPEPGGANGYSKTCPLMRPKVRAYTHQGHGPRADQQAGHISATSAIHA